MKMKKIKITLLFLLCSFTVTAMCGDRKSGIPNLKLGIVSDVHIIADGSGKMDVSDWEKALRWFDENKADAVVCAGDLTQFAKPAELEAFAQSWHRIFPDNRAADGRHVEPVFIYGNHEIEGWMYTVDKNDKAAMDAAFRQSIAGRPAELWKLYLNEEFAPYFIKDVKGYKFLCMHWGEEEKITEALEKYGNGLKNDRLFFVVQHPVFKNTVNSYWCWGQDDGTGTKALSDYPNAVALCGHCHMPLNDETTIWQGDFTAIGTSSLRAVEGRRGRENRPFWGAPVSQMPMVPDWGYENHGMLMTVYDDCLVIERMSFKNDLGKLTDDWVVPWPNDRSFSFENRKSEYAKNPPEFAAGAENQITIKKISGKNAKNEPTEQIAVGFPTALAGRHIPMDYEVRAEIEQVDVINIYRSKRVYAPGVFKRDSIMRQAKTAECVFATDEIPANAQVRFAITPFDHFGNSGRTIYSQTVYPNKL